MSDALCLATNHCAVVASFIPSQHRHRSLPMSLLCLAPQCILALAVVTRSEDI
ncbi:hypothetical protein SESBI_48026 [Sesbania bispinosa]|nr:hypothetical protein SESBI_48026 [Sesbania bispinosa]